MQKWSKALCGMMSAVLLLSGCGAQEEEQEKLPGQTLIEAARAEYSELDSAVVTTTNLNTNQAEQTFVFKYDEVGMMLFSLVLDTDDRQYAEYNTGYQSEIRENGETKSYSRGMTDFAAYSREYPHPLATKGLIAFERSSVTDSQVTEENGNTLVTYHYEPSAFAEGQDLQDYYCVYVFDSADKLLYFDAVSVSKNGETLTYRTEITNQNNVEKIENPLETAA